jgi:hypothetical protein
MTTLPPEWALTSVGQVLSLKYGKALDPTLRDPNAPSPVVGSVGRMTGTHEPLVDEPVVLIGRKGNVGAVQLVSTGCWPIDTTYYAAIPRNLDARFLLHQLIALEMKKLDSSTTTPSLRRQDLEEQRLVVPPLDEQHRIVELLDDHTSPASTPPSARPIRRGESKRRWPGPRGAGSSLTTRPLLLCSMWRRSRMVRLRGGCCIFS